MNINSMQRRSDDLNNVKTRFIRS